MMKYFFTINRFSETLFLFYVITVSVKVSEREEFIRSFFFLMLRRKFARLRKRKKRKICIKIYIKCIII